MIIIILIKIGLGRIMDKFKDIINEIEGDEK